VNNPSKGWKKGEVMKKSVRMVLCLVLVAIMATGMVFASGSNEKAAVNEKANLLVSVWAGPHADLQKKVGMDFQAANVTIDDVDYGSLKQKQLTSFQAVSGSGNYDVVWVNSQWMKEYTDAGYLLPLDSYIKAAGVDTGMYAKGLFDGCVFNGQTYGLPTFAQTMIIAYDSEVFEKEGIAVPANADELIAVAKYFKAKGTGIALPAKQGSAAVTLFSQLLFSDGGYYFDEKGNLDIASENAIQAATIYDELVKNSVEGCLAWHHDEVAEAVRMKDAPIGLIMSGLANQNADPEKSLIVDSVKYAPLAGKSGTAAATNSFWVWAVAKNSANVQKAADYVIWMTSFETEKKQTLADQQISAINSLGTDSEILSKAPFLPVVMQQLSAGKIDPPLANFGKLKASLVVSLSEIASTDAMPRDVMNRLQVSLKDIDFSK
jgi:ABC-type glycerol-3-phosphate transport system substrate-binding protein